MTNRLARPAFGVCAGLLAAAAVVSGQYPASFQVTKDGASVTIEDYATVPPSSLMRDNPYPAPLDARGQRSRVNALASEPAGAPRSADRFFVIDQNGVLYLLDKATRAFTPYIDVGRTFGRFTNTGSLGMGVGTIVFDPAYATNGRFYTNHNERPDAPGAARPAVRAEAANLAGYVVTPAINPPAGPASYDSVLVEWTDTNIGNATFEGTAREVLRVGMSYPLHPMGDMLFNPLARRGDADYGNLYIAVGDGTAGERPGVTHSIPQRLDALTGKILRITPDITLRAVDRLSGNGRYRIPSIGANANPFVSVAGARGEVYAYGFRNPHRLTWDAVTNTLLANDIGHKSWEEINIVTRGGNYGWAEREGPEVVFIGGPNDIKTASQVGQPMRPSPDTVTVEGIDTPVAPIYPVAAFSHREGTAIGSGFVYRGKLMPQLTGKYVFSEIVTGRMFYADLAEMRAAQGAAPGGHAVQLAPIHELQVIYQAPGSAAASNRRMFDIVADTFVRRNGTPGTTSALPGGATGTGRGQLDPYGVAYGGGRSDVRFAVGGDGEIYVLSKSDGMIRKIVGGSV